MKYNEFVALKEQLEKDGTSLKEFAGVEGDYLFEADPMGTGIDLGDASAEAPKDEKPAEGGEEKKSDDSLDTKGGKAGIGSALKPAYIIRRKKLINNAKKFMKMGKEQLIEKFLPKILKSQEHTAAAAVAAAQEGKQPKEVAEVLKVKAKEAGAIQESQLKELKTALSKIGQGFEARVKKIIASEKLSEKEKMVLNNYWILLSQQVHQKLYASIVKRLNESTKKVVQDNPELEKVINNFGAAKNYNAQLEQIKQDVKKQQEEVKKSQEELKAEEKPAEGGEEEHKLEVGQKYKVDFGGKEGVDVEVLEIGEEGNPKIKYGEEGKVVTLKRDNEKNKKFIDLLSKEALVKPEGEEAETKPEPEPAEA